MAHEHIVYMMLVEAAVAAGDLQEIERLAPKLEELAERDGHRPYLAVAARARGAVRRMRGEFENSEAALNAALEVFEEMAMDWQAGRTLTELGTLEACRNNQDAAEVYFNRAMDIFERLRAKPAFERAREALNAAV